MQISNKNKKIASLLIKNILFPIVAIAALLFFLPKLIAFFLPFLIGWLIACLASPIVRFIENKLKIHRKAGAVFVISGSIALVVFIIYVIAEILVTQSIEFARTIPDIVSNASSAVNEVGYYLGGLLEKLPVEVRDALNNGVGEASSYLSGLVSRGSEFFMEMASGIIKQIPMALLSTVVCVLSAYFFVSEKDKIAEGYKEKIPDKIKNTISLIVNGARHAIGGYFVAQIKIEVFVYACLLIGFLLLKVDFAWFVALVIAILDFLPIFGTGTAIVPWAVVESLNGEYMRAVALIVIWGLSQLLRQFLQPKFVSNQVGLSEFATLFLLYAGFVVGGIIGMILSLPIGIVFVSLNQAGVFEPVKSNLKELLSLIMQKEEASAGEGN